MYREALLAHAEHLGPDGFPIPTEDPVSPPFRRLLGVSALLVGLLLAPVGLGWAGYAEFSGVTAGNVTHEQTTCHQATSAPGIAGSAEPGRQRLAGTSEALQPSHRLSTIEGARPPSRWRTAAASVEIGTAT